MNYEYLQNIEPFTCCWYRRHSNTYSNKGDIRYRQTYCRFRAPEQLGKNKSCAFFLVKTCWEVLQILILLVCMLWHLCCIALNIYLNAVSHDLNKKTIQSRFFHTKKQKEKWVRPHKTSLLDLEESFTLYFGSWIAEMGKEGPKQYTEYIGPALFIKRLIA